MLSVIIPAYNEEENILAAAEAAADVLRSEKIPFEMIFVDDGSKDATWERITEAKERFPEVRGVSFSRNFGKEAAIAAGLSEAHGDCCAVMDADLQHPVEKLVEMYRLWEDGYEVVEGVKRSRGKESGAHGFAAGWFYRLMSRASGIDMRSASDFKLLDRKAVDALLSMPERNAFFRAASSWIGFKSTSVHYDVRERQAGTTKWSTGALTRYAVKNITSFTTAPMRIVFWLGVLTFLVGLVLSVIALAQKIAGVSLGGFTTVIILLCFFSSIVMVSLGIIGYYLSKIYEEIQARPKYIISRRV